jgi:hypothetical protein
MQRAQVIGSALSGLMVLRDLDVMFDAPDATAVHALTCLAAASRPHDSPTSASTPQTDNHNQSRFCHFQRLLSEV